MRPLPYMIYATSNRGAVGHCDRYACVYCVKIYDTAKTPVVDYIADRTGETAVCPTCSIDAVVPLCGRPFEGVADGKIIQQLAHWRWQGFDSYDDDEGDSYL